jgi:hypothetical protein
MQGSLLWWLFECLKSHIAERHAVSPTRVNLAGGLVATLIFVKKAARAWSATYGFHLKVGAA